MANALNSGPEVAPQQQPGGNALQGATAPGSMPAQAQGAQQPQISHAQAVAALRHFSAISRELETFLKDPELGKSNVKSKIIDGTTKLVAQRIITAPQAVQQLDTVPADPLMQRKWVQQHFQQTMLAMNAVLDHHAAGNQGTGDPQIETARSQYAPDDHMHDMAAVHSGYQGMSRG